MAQLTVRLGPDDQATLGVPEAMAFDPGKLRMTESLVLETIGYPDPDQWIAALDAGQMRAVFALVHLACRRHGYRGAFSEFDFELTELAIDAPEPDPAGDAPGEEDAPPAGESPTP